jgi:hypothetical protein
MTFQQIKTAIRDGSFDLQLEAIQRVVNRRQKQVRKQNLYRPRIGDKVTICDWYPQTTEGRVGTVLYSNKDMAIVTFVTEDQQFIDCHVPLGNCAPARQECDCE